MIIDQYAYQYVRWNCSQCVACFNFSDTFGWKALAAIAWCLCWNADLQNDSTQNRKHWSSTITVWESSASYTLLTNLPFNGKYLWRVWRPHSLAVWHCAVHCSTVSWMGSRLRTSTVCAYHQFVELALDHPYVFTRLAESKQTFHFLTSTHMVFGWMWGSKKAGEETVEMSPEARAKLQRKCQMFIVALVCDDLWLQLSWCSARGELESLSTFAKGAAGFSSSAKECHAGLPALCSASAT